MAYADNVTEVVKATYHRVTKEVDGGEIIAQSHPIPLKGIEYPEELQKLLGPHERHLQLMCLRHLLWSDYLQYE